jgi:hypothetical protein
VTLKKELLRVNDRKRAEVKKFVDLHVSTKPLAMRATSTRDFFNRWRALPGSQGVVHIGYLSFSRHFASVINTVHPHAIRSHRNQYGWKGIGLR